MDACTGETTVIATSENSKAKLNTANCVTDEQWQWIDRVYTASILNEQFNYYGKYSGGFFNSIFGQAGVKVTSEGYSLPRSTTMYICTRALLPLFQTSR